MIRVNYRIDSVPERILSHSNPTTHARVVHAAADDRRDRLNQVAAKGEACARGVPRPSGVRGAGARGPYSATLHRPARPEHHHALRVGRRRGVDHRLQPFPSKQALSSAGRLRRSQHGPYIDLAQPFVRVRTPTPSSPSSALTASGGLFQEAAGRPQRSL